MNKKQKTEKTKVFEQIWESMKHDRYNFLYSKRNKLIKILRIW